MPSEKISPNKPVTKPSQKIHSKIIPLRSFEFSIISFNWSCISFSHSQSSREYLKHDTDTAFQTPDLSSIPQISATHKDVCECHAVLHSSALGY